MKLLLSFFVLLKLFSTPRCHGRKIEDLSSGENTLSSGSENLHTYNLPIVLQQGSSKNETTENSINVSNITTFNNEKEVEPYENNESDNKINSIALEYNFILNVKAKILTAGVLKLKAIGHEIKKYFNMTVEDTNPIINYIIQHYPNELNEYFNDISKQQVNYEIETEFYVLNMIEISNNIFFQECKLLSDNIMAYVHTEVLEKDVIYFSDLVHKNVVDEKITNLKYICHKLEICRPFPAYSDHVAELLSVIVKFPNVKFATVIEVLNEIVETKQSFFKKIMDEKSFNQIGIESKCLTGNITTARNFVSIVSDIISQRYKILHSKDGKFSIEIKAFRILIDMIDKAFEMLEQNYVDIELINVTNALKDWAEGRNNDVQTILMDHVNNFEEVLELYWVPAVRQEVKVLIKVLVTEVQNADILLYGYLFIKGSQFVNGEIGVPERDTLDMLNEIPKSYKSKYF